VFIHFGKQGKVRKTQFIWNSLEKFRSFLKKKRIFLEFNK
jgi:hypothetical protein